MKTFRENFVKMFSMIFALKKCSRSFHGRFSQRFFFKGFKGFHDGVSQWVFTMGFRKGFHNRVYLILEDTVYFFTIRNTSSRPLRFGQHSARGERANKFVF